MRGGKMSRKHKEKMKGDDRQLRLATRTTSCIVWVFAKPAIENNRENM